jgi:hypothetical protein
MSEKTPMQQTQTQADFLHWLKCSSEWNARIALRDARDRKAEAAERAIEVWMAWCDSGNANGTWDAFAKAVAEYKSAREAVRKMEDGT